MLVPHVGYQITDAAGNIIHEFETEIRKTVTMTPTIWVASARACGT